MDGRPIWTDCDVAGDYVVPNVLSPRDLVSRPDIMDETVPHTSNNAEPEQTPRSDLGQHCLIAHYSNMGYLRYEQVTASTNNQTNMAFIS